VPFSNAAALAARTAPAVPYGCSPGIHKAAHHSCTCRATTDTQQTAGEASSSLEFVDCPFFGHRHVPALALLPALKCKPRELHAGWRGCKQERALQSAAAAAASRHERNSRLAHSWSHALPCSLPALCCRCYEPVRELFRTTLGQVYLARNKEKGGKGSQVVIKMIERGPSVSKHVESELLIHRRVLMCVQCVLLLRLLHSPGMLLAGPTGSSAARLGLSGAGSLPTRCLPCRWASGSMGQPIAVGHGFPSWLPHVPACAAEAAAAACVLCCCAALIFLALSFLRCRKCTGHTNIVQVRVSTAHMLGAVPATTWCLLCLNTLLPADLAPPTCLPAAVDRGLPHTSLSRNRA
jgi:hypothetical protein